MNIDPIIMTFTESMDENGVVLDQELYGYAIDDLRDQFPDSREAIEFLIANLPQKLLATVMRW